MPLSPTDRVRIIALLSCSMASFISNLIIMAVAVKHWAKVKQSVASTLSFNLIVSDLIMALVGIPINVVKLVNDELDYETGSSFCQTEGTLVTISGMVLMTTNIIIAVERYFAILRNRRMSLKDVSTLSAAGYVWVVTLALLPCIIPDSPYVMHPTALYCLHDQWATKLSVLVPVYLNSATYVGGLIFIGYVYGSIAILVYRQRKILASADVISLRLKKGKKIDMDGHSRQKIQASHSMSSLDISCSDSKDTLPPEIFLVPAFSERGLEPPSSESPLEFPSAEKSLEPPSSEKPLGPSSTSNPSSETISPPRSLGKPLEMSKKDRNIYFKVICIAGGYALCWGPYGIVIIAEIFGRSKIQLEFSMMASMLCVLNPMVNTVIIGFLDPVFKRFLAHELQFWTSLFRQPVPEVATANVQTHRAGF